MTGQKVWTTFAHKAKWCMLVARTDQDVPKHQGLTYFLLDMEQEAVQVRPLHQITKRAGVQRALHGGGPDPRRARHRRRRQRLAGGDHHPHERARRPRRRSGRVGVKIALDELKELARERGADEDPVIRQQLGQLTIEVEAAAPELLARPHDDHEARRARPGGLAAEVAVGARSTNR